MMKLIHTILFLLCCMANSYSQNEPKNGLSEKLDSIFKMHYSENHTQKQIKTAKKTVDSILTHAQFSDSIYIKGNYNLQVPKMETVFSEDKKVRVIEISPVNLPKLRLVQYSNNREDLYRFSAYIAQLKLKGEIRMLIDEIYHLKADEYVFTATNFGSWTSPEDVHAFVVDLAPNELNSNPEMLFRSNLTIHFSHFGPEIDTKPFFKILYDGKSNILTTPVHSDGEIKGTNLYKYDSEKGTFSFLKMKAAPLEQE